MLITCKSFVSCNYFSLNFTAEIYWLIMSFFFLFGLFKLLMESVGGLNIVIYVLMCFKTVGSQSCDDTRKFPSVVSRVCVGGLKTHADTQARSLPRQRLGWGGGGGDEWGERATMRSALSRFVVAVTEALDFPPATRPVNEVCPTEKLKGLVWKKKKKEPGSHIADLSFSTAFSSPDYTGCPISPKKSDSKGVP